MTTVPTTLHSPEHLHAATVAIWEALGGPAEEARLLADHLVAASLAGHDSHGVGMIPDYAASLDAGTLVAGRRPEVVADTGVVLTLDAGFGLGQVAAHDAMVQAIDRARRHGAAVVGLRRTHHVGRVGHWAEQCAAAGFASLHLVSVPGDAFVAPHGGGDARIGTNPFCAAFPRPGADPVLADFATSHLALGKTRVAHNAGRPVPEGALLDADGRPTTDPGVMWRDPRGALLTTGAHKGSALAVLVELLAGAMVGGGVTDEDSLAAPHGIVNSMFSLVVDPTAFGAEDPQAAADSFLSFVAASPPREGTGEVLLPGEPERRARERRSRDGVPLDATTWAQIEGVAARAGVDLSAIDPAD